MSEPLFTQEDVKAIDNVLPLVFMSQTYAHAPLVAVRERLQSWIDRGKTFESVAVQPHRFSSVD